MKSLLDENSLPLVNLTVDISTVNRTDYVQGEIEITDYLRRTDPESQTVHYQCKLRYLGHGTENLKSGMEIPSPFRQI